MNTKINFALSLFLLFVLVFLQFGLVQPAYAACSGVIYVDVNSGVANANGCSWGTAFTKLQDALALASSGDEIWVAAGTYYPDEGAGQSNDSRASTFALKNGVDLYGGFAGTESQLVERDPVVNVTVLSGDIGTVGVSADNAYHVVWAAGITSATVVDGVRIQHGYADVGNDFGGGMYVVNSSGALQLRGVTFTNNYAGNGGGLATFVSDPVLSRVVFNSNTARQYGGGLYNQDGSPVLVDVIFDNNQTQQPASPGGGMHSTNSNSAVYTVAPSLTNVTFSDNRALQGGGGGMFNFESHAILTNVTFSGNSAYVRGGAMLNEGSNPVMNNVTFSGNTAPAGTGGAMRNIYALGVMPSHPVIRNAVLWGNGSEEIVTDGGSSVTISDSVVQGGCPGLGSCTNVVDADPVLGALTGNGGFTQTMALGAGSAAVDAGNNTTCAATDQRGVSRPQGSACDMGAYEAETGTPPTNTPVPPTATNTAVFTPTYTSTPTVEFTPTNTLAPPTATFTFTPTNTSIPPTATYTNTPTNTPVPPTATSTFTPTLTPISPTFTFTPTLTFTPTATATAILGTDDVLFLSSSTGGSVGGVSFADEDILQFDRATGNWSMYFDGSDVGVTSDVDAFARMLDGTILLSLDVDGSVSGLGTVDDSDIIRFTPTSLGVNTAGSFSLYFDGSDVGLSTSSEDIDAIDFTSDGKLVVSTLGSFGVTGVSGNDEDLIVFTASSLGSNTAGSWAFYFDGSDVGLSQATSEQVNEIWIDPLENTIYLTTVGAFAVTGVSGDGADVFICTPGTLGANTTCTYTSYWDGSLFGFGGEVVDGLDIQN